VSWWLLTDLEGLRRNSRLIINVLGYQKTKIFCRNSKRFWQNYDLRSKS